MLLKHSLTFDIESLSFFLSLQAFTLEFSRDRKSMSVYVESSEPTSGIQTRSRSAMGGGPRMFCKVRL